MVVPPLRTEFVDVIGAADAAVGGLTAALAERLPMRYAMIWVCISFCSFLFSFSFFLGGGVGSVDVLAHSRFVQVLGVCLVACRLSS